ncbi:(Lyso)-N-acylphosphatidylethanolamine lipase-like isoform X2 [Babylonia areolata]|uniref:(Lyso)-N-acylphosphatidylethanolamine lipase-like isoform X2 n=1 Tax=Babylonia areolata TaxID=304850 RepID=UPI003FD1E007
MMAGSSPSETNSFFFKFLQWRQTSFKDLESIDKKILDSLPCIQKKDFVAVDNSNKLWSVVCGTSKEDRTPVVMVHGMGGGVGLWALNLESLSRSRPVYAFDLLGFGRSSRPVFSSDAKEAENMFVESIENYRRAMGLEKFILLGHSLGGFLSAAYTLRYPQHVKHLILVDPWGMPRRPTDNHKSLPLAVRLVLSVVDLGYPMSVLRILGPFGPSLVKKYRPQLAETFGNKLGDDSLLHDYIYHCNAQDPSGEIGFKNMTEGFGWAKYPMMERMADIDPSLPITFVYGAESWIDRRTGLNFQRSRRGYVDVQIIQGAGHHVYADRCHLFNSLVETICQGADQNRPPHIGPELVERIHGVASFTCLQLPDPGDPDFQHPVGHGDENTQTVFNQDCDDGGGGGGCGGDA